MSDIFDTARSLSTLIDGLALRWRRVEGDDMEAFLRGELGNPSEEEGIYMVFLWENSESVTIIMKVVVEGKLIQKSHDFCDTTSDEVALRRLLILALLEYKED